MEKKKIKLTISGNSKKTISNIELAKSQSKNAVVIQKKGNRIGSKPSFYKKPNQGDLVVFKTPSDNRTDYIKRIIGLPGDTIQFKEGFILINEKKIIRKKIKNEKKIRCGEFDFEVNAYEETLPNGSRYIAVYNKLGTLQNSKKFNVPTNHYFLLGDNRDCSKDSRYLDEVGYVNSLNLVGKAKIIFFSNDTINSNLFKFWNLHNSFRLDRTFKIIK